jgi:sigma-B regulation protein RsbU (phosphoserine phosphatase)
VNKPAIAGFHLTRQRAIVLAAVIVDAFLAITGRGGPLPAMLTFILFVYAGWKLIRMLFERTRLIWHLRNRLIVTYVFIAVVPITLILALVFVAGYLLTGQVSAYLLGSALERQNVVIDTAATRLAKESPEDRMSTVQQLTATGIPAFEAIVSSSTPGGPVFRYPADATVTMPTGDWKDYTGIVYKDGKYFLMSLVNSGKMRGLILRALTPDDQANLVRGLGSIRLPLPEWRAPEPAAAAVSGRKPINVLLNGRSLAFGDDVAGAVPPPENVLDLDVNWLPPIEIADWNQANSQSVSAALITTRPSAVLGIVSRSQIDSSVALYAFYLLAGLLGVAWLISLYIGISMTRNITGAVHNLYTGTTRIGQGDFEHVIPVKGTDQLADLGHSFNNMAGQLKQFVVVTREKERLQSEIAIASEVQTRLFPLKPPAAKTIEMLGVCHAARSVSGDYYDYFTAADGELAIALGDVAGKGISAALLMASIQSIMRTQLSDAGAAITPANTVARLNRLLYASTSPEKYATFFFGLYSEQTRRLVYTNAGHLPPLLIHTNSYELLEVTGSVVGAFPSLRYEEQRIQIGPGDLLVAYTDGITEPENAYGEDFGADRLAEVILRHREACPEEIVAKVLEAVRHWDTSTEQADDMTLMIVRGL